MVEESEVEWTHDLRGTPRPSRKTYVLLGRKTCVLLSFDILTWQKQLSFSITCVRS